MGECGGLWSRAPCSESQSPEDPEPVMGRLLETPCPERRGQEAQSRVHRTLPCAPHSESGLMPTAAEDGRGGSCFGPRHGSLGTNSKQLCLCCTRRPFRCQRKRLRTLSRERSPGPGNAAPQRTEDSAPLRGPGGLSQEGGHAGHPWLMILVLVPTASLSTPPTHRCDPASTASTCGKWVRVVGAREGKAGWLPLWPGVGAVGKSLDEE